MQKPAPQQQASVCEATGFIHQVVRNTANKQGSQLIRRLSKVAQRLYGWNRDVATTTRFERFVFAHHPTELHFTCVAHGEGVRKCVCANAKRVFLRDRLQKRLETRST